MPTSEQPSKSQLEHAKKRARSKALRASTTSIIMTVEEAAAYMRLSPQTIYDDCNANPPRIPHIRQGKRILVIKPLLDELIMKRALQTWGVADASSGTDG